MKQKEMEDIKRTLRNQIKSLEGIVDEGRDRFRKGENRVWISLKKNKVRVNIGTGFWYSYTSKEEVMQYEFELKGVIQYYMNRGVTTPRLSLEDRLENEKRILYCTIEAAGIKTEFKPKWFELLNGVNQMVFVEYKNAKKTEKDSMVFILKSLKKITRRVEKFYKELGYDL